MMNVETQKLRIVEVTGDILFRKREVLFACIFGSFVEREDYQDIDVAVYLGKLQNVETLRFELFLEEELERSLGVPLRCPGYQ
jgi:predicted nucleotidyltransferase